MVIECLAKSARLKLKEVTVVGVPKFMATCSGESWHFGNLRILGIDVSMNGSSNSVSIKETVDAMLRGIGCSHSLPIWESLPESIQNLTALFWLQLENFGIEEMPEWFGNLPSLERLQMHGCKKLRCVDALRRLTKLIEDCPEVRIDSKCPPGLMAAGVMHLASLLS